MADQIHQVGGILAVVDGEGRIEADALGVFPQQPRPDAVKRTGPAQGVRHDAGVVTEHLARDPLDPPRHFRGGTAREGHQQDAAWVGAADDQVRDAVGEGIGLARSGAGDHQQWRPDGGGRPDAVLDGAPLLRIERIQICVFER